MISYAAAIEFLYGLRLFGAKLGLANTRRLAALAGNPQERLRFIHVAGTNGKGSTCAFLESVYRASGLRVGLYTSPHLVRFTERIQVDRQLMPEADVVRLVTEMQEWLREFPVETHPTFFEVVTVMALRYFAEQKCDLVIWETGLGGRLDATNIVTPLASVITNVQLDHQQWLGETLPQIATEKAGIIKPGVPVVTAAAEPEVIAVIKATAEAQQVPLHFTEAANLPAGQSLSLLGKHQQTNAALAATTVQVLQKILPVTPEVLRAGLAGAHWPGRCQLVTRPSGQTVLLDGAHNPAGAEALAATLRQLYPEKKPALILGVLDDKDKAAFCRIIAPCAGKIYLTPVASERTAAPEKLQALCAAGNSALKIVITRNLKDALTEAAAEPHLIIAGSLYLMGEAMELLEISPTPDASERGLNEWGGKPKG